MGQVLEIVVMRSWILFFVYLLWSAKHATAFLCRVEGIQFLVAVKFCVLRFCIPVCFVFEDIPQPHLSLAVILIEIKANSSTACLLLHHVEFADVLTLCSASRLR